MSLTMDYEDEGDYGGETKADGEGGKDEAREKDLLINRTIMLALIVAGGMA